MLVASPAFAGKAAGSSSGEEAEPPPRPRVQHAHEGARASTYARTFCGLVARVQTRSLVRSTAADGVEPRD